MTAYSLECELVHYPDKGFICQLLCNLLQGCAIGYCGPQFTLTASHLPSAFQQPAVIDSILEKEIAANRILGLFSKLPMPIFCCSGMGVVPKHDGGWRIIYHLSAPPGRSINDFIDSDAYTLSYCSVDDAYAIINSL